MSETDRVEALLKSSPWTWIDGRRFAQVGGAYGWRTRISDCRTKRGMTIENRVRTARNRLTGNSFKISEYRWIPEVNERGTIQ